MINQDIIKRYLNGEATEGELHILRSYLESRDLSLLKEWMAKDWLQAGNENKDLPPGLSAKILQKVKQQIAGSKVVPLKKKRRPKRWFIAASVLLILGIGIGLWWDSPVTVITYATGFGEWKTLELPDGSSVKLNANSVIKYAEKWPEGTDREVWLTGEAFFTVEKKPATGAKFRVITEDLQIEVLGTSFNVSCRDKQTDVFLEEGSIKLSMGEQEQTMQPGDFVIYSAEKNAILEQRNESITELYTSWKDGVLILKDKSISEILKKIEAIYGIKILVLDTALLAKVKTIAVPMDKLEVTLPVLEKTFEARITQQGDQLIVQ